MPLKIINYCKNGDLEGLSRCLDCSTINQPDIWGRCPIYYAVRYNSPKAVCYIHSMGADVFIMNKIAGDSEDLLVTAFKTASTIVQTIIKYYQAQPAHMIHIKLHMNNYLPYIFRGKTDNLKSFIEGFKIYDFKGYEPILCKTAKKEHYQVLTDQNICFDLQSTLRYTIVYRRYTAFLHLLSLVRYGEQLNYVYRGPQGSQQTLLSLCCSNGYLKGIRLLIEQGANIALPSVNERQESRNNLMSAVDRRITKQQQAAAIKCIKYLIRYYPINEQNSRGQTVLMFAERMGHTIISTLLVDMGADPDIIDMHKKKACEYSL